VYGTLSVAKALTGTAAGMSGVAAAAELLLSGSVVDLSSARANATFVAVVNLVGTVSATSRASGTTINLLAIAGTSRSISSAHGVVLGRLQGVATGGSSAYAGLTVPLVTITVTSVMSAGVVTSVQSAGSVTSVMSAGEVDSVQSAAHVASAASGASVQFVSA
jgi:hypothetical protein